MHGVLSLQPQSILFYQQVMHIPTLMLCLSTKQGNSTKLKKWRQIILINNNNEQYFREAS